MTNTDNLQLVLSSCFLAWYLLDLDHDHFAIPVMHCGEEQLAVYVSDKVPEFLIGDPGRIRQIITNLIGNSVKVSRGNIVYAS